MPSPAVTRTTAAAAAASVALLAAGCGGSTNHNPTNNSAASGHAPAGGIAAAAFRYAACIRSHGVPNFPDPQVQTTGPGSVRIAMMAKQSVVNQPQFSAAQTACRGIMPAPGNQSSDQQDHVHAQALLAFAQCLRSHGVPNFPDPTSQGQLSAQTITAAGVDLRAPAVLTAAKACVSVTHGQITTAMVEQAINHATGQSGG